MLFILYNIQVRSSKKLYKYLNNYIFYTAQMNGRGNDNKQQTTTNHKNESFHIESVMTL
jgi:hypothetical protein